VEILVPGLWRLAPLVSRGGTPGPLSRMLGRGRLLASASGGWEAELAADLGFRPGRHGRRRWLALPVTLTVGMTDLIASPVDDWTPDERTALRAVLEPDLAQAGATWHEAVPGLVELELEGGGDWPGRPPSMGLGQPMRMPGLEDPMARRIQILANAVQMLWFDHPVNRERAAAGRAPVHGLWLWSPGTPVEAPAVRRIAGGGGIAHWLAEAVDIPWSGDPLEPEADRIVIEALVRTDGDGVSAPGGGDEVLATLVTDVLEPQLRRLRAGAVDELRLHDPGTACLRVTRSEWRRFWRRSRALWSVPPGQV